MRRSLQLLSALVLLIVFLVGVGCANGEIPSGATRTGIRATPTLTPLEPVMTSIQVKVDTTHNECQRDLPTKPGTCYLPFYTDATYDDPSMPINSAPDSKCTPENESQCWGQPGTQLTAVCTTDGQQIRDTRMVNNAVWVGVVIPPSEILIDVSNLRAIFENGGAGRRVGFAPALWLRQVKAQPELDDLDRCEDILVTTG